MNVEHISNLLFPGYDDKENERSARAALMVCLCFVLCSAFAYDVCVLSDGITDLGLKNKYDLLTLCPCKTLQMIWVPLLRSDKKAVAGPIRRITHETSLAEGSAVESRSCVVFPCS